MVNSQSRLGSREQRQSIVEDVVVSPSRFTPLMGIEEEVADEVEEVDLDVEEGEIANESEHSPKDSRGPLVAKKNSVLSNQKSAKQRIVRARDLKFVGRQGNSKKTSVRKL